MSKNPKKKKNLVHAPPCDQLSIVRTLELQERGGRPELILLWPSSQTWLECLGSQCQVSGSKTGISHLLLFISWPTFGKMQEKPKKGSRKTLLGTWDGEDGIWGVNWYLREGNVIFLLLVQMRKCRWTAWRQRKSRQRRPWAWESRYDGRWGNQTFLKWMMTTKKYF